MKKQQALIFIKPDAVQRGLIGKIIKRFEQVGLKIIAFKFIWATKEQVSNHYPSYDAWFQKVGERTLNNYKNKGLDAKKILGTNNAIAIGKLVKSWLINYICQGPILCAVVEGYDVISIIRKLCGDTNPVNALPGTIRGDFTSDSIELANHFNRPIHNIIHASDNLDDAKKEIATWFLPEEIFSYQRVDEELIFADRHNP